MYIYTYYNIGGDRELVFLVQVVSARIWCIIYRLPPAELQKEKIDVGGLQNSSFGGGIKRFACLERPGPGFSVILLIFIDFV